MAEYLKDEELIEARDLSRTIKDTDSPSIFTRISKAGKAGAGFIAKEASIVGQRGAELTAHEARVLARIGEAEMRALQKEQKKEKSFIDKRSPVGRLISLMEKSGKAKPKSLSSYSSLDLTEMADDEFTALARGMEVDKIQLRQILAILKSRGIKYTTPPFMKEETFARLKKVI